MSVGITSERILKGFTPQRSLGSSCSDLTLVVLTNPVNEPSDLSATELADLRSALELDFGPDLSGLGVYVGRKAGHHGTDSAGVAIFSFGRTAI
jgi:hypothetical protein